MAAFHNRSIQSKITTVIMLTSCAALMAACAGFIVYELLTYRTTLVRQLSVLTEITGKNCNVPVSFNNAEQAEGILANLSTEKQIIAAAIYKDGMIWARYPKDRPDQAFVSAPPAGTHQFRDHRLMLSRVIIDPDSNAIGTLS